MPNNSSTPPYTPTYGTPAQLALWPMIYNTSINANVPPDLAYSLMTTEGLYSNGAWQPNQTSGAQGPFQLLPTTANGLGQPDAVNPNSPNFLQANVTAGVAVLAQDLNATNGNVANAIFAYKGAISDNGKASVSSAVQKTLSQAGVDQTVTPPQQETINLSRTAGSYIPIANNGNLVSTATLQSLTPDIVIKTGLDVKPWYSDPNLITGNPRLRKEVQPVTFKVYLSDHLGNFVLSDQGRTGKPLIMQLNASMKSYNIASKHLFFQQRTRTAFHITMWGMQADVIEGQCTTGVFMNQLGLTDYFSTFKASPALQKLATNGKQFNSMANPTNPNGVIGGVVSTTQTSGSSNLYQHILNSLSNNNPNFDQNSVFRVAAQDAFQELLSLFKMNGSAWFFNKSYQDNVGETRDWTGIQAWSPTLGINSQQINSRNNDVISRGTVVMQFRNVLYEGYFKSLQWEMNADKPFSWDFSFIFQIERTVGREYLPQGY